MIIEQPSRRLSLRRLIPRFTLRALLFAVVLVAVTVRVTQWAWPKYVLYRQNQDYVALQATKQSFVDDQRRRHQDDKLKNPSTFTLAVDDSRPVPDDYVILLRSGNTFGCIIPRNQGKKGESLEYDWYLRTDGQGRFPIGSPEVQTGHAFAGPGTAKLVHAIKFGPFDFEWSGNGVGWGYLYYRTQSSVSPQSTEREPIAIDHPRLCTTNIKSVELLDARDPKWIYIALPGDEGVPGNVDLNPSPNEPKLNQDK